MLQKTNIRNVRFRMFIPAFLLLTSVLYVQCSKDTLPAKDLDISDTNGPDENGVYKIVDKMPEFEGDIVQYLASNIKYPKDAQERKVEGRVTLKFIVDEQGNVGNVRILRSPDESLSNAARDVLENMPQWKPGESKGEKVKVYFTLPIAFQLPEKEADKPKSVK